MTIKYLEGSNKNQSHTLNILSVWSFERPTA